MSFWFSQAFFEPQKSPPQRGGGPFVISQFRDMGCHHGNAYYS